MKISNLMVTAAISVSGLIGIAPPAYAGYTCDTDFLGRRVCETDSGETYTIDKDFLGRDTIDGPDGTMTCDEDFLGRYRCD